VSDKIAGAPAEVAATPEPAAAPAPPAAAPPAPAAPIQLELTPPPAPPAPVAAPEPAKPEAPAKADPGVAALKADLEAELERTRSAREAVEAISQRTVDRSRVEYLRKMGVSNTLSDEHLLTLAPGVDPDTTSGAQALQTWRDANSALFAHVEEGATVTAKLVEKFKTSTHGTFGPEFHRAQMQATFGGDDGR